MEAFLLGFCTIMTAGVLIRRYTKPQIASMQNTNSESREDSPLYYKQLVSENNHNDFIDYSNGLMGI